MKSLSILFFLGIFLSPLHVSYANNSPTPHKEHFTIASINFKMDKELVDTYGMEIIFNKRNENLDITLDKEVSFLQIMNAAGALEYQLPVYSKSVILDLNDFEKGDYALNLLLDNETMLPASFTR